MTDIDNIADAAPRRPVVAALLSLALPGLGQLQNGELNKGVWFFLAFALAGMPGIVISTLYAPTWLMAPLLAATALLTFGLWIAAIFDAWRTARREPLQTRRAWQVSGVYALLFLLGNAALYLGLALGMRAHFVKAFSIPGESMAPNVLRGDFITADRRYNCPDCKGRVIRGDVGIFVYPNDRTLHYIKRVIGLPGDRIAIKGHDILVNGEKISGQETPADDHVLVTEQSGERKWRVEWKKASGEGASADYVVPPAEIFVLGDNRDDSKDSRAFGFVPLADLVGKARQVWFSTGPQGIRWDRIGQVIE